MAGGRRINTLGAVEARALVGKGQKLDGSGRIVPKDGPHFYRGGQGELYLRLGSWLHTPSGSPERIDVNITREFAAAVLALMEISSDDVLVPDPAETPEFPGTPRTVTEGLLDLGTADTDLQTEIDAAEAAQALFEAEMAAELAELQPTDEKGVALGYAELDASGKVPVAQLPATMTPAAHAVEHENGGGDEISVAGLSGLLADDQNPVAHASDHEDGGADEIDVTGLSGLLADAQTPLAHTHPVSAWLESGIATISGGTVTVSSAYITANPTGSTVQVTWATPGLSRPLAVDPGTIMDNTSFDITASDDGDVHWMVIKKV